MPNEPAASNTTAAVSTAGDWCPACLTRHMPGMRCHQWPVSVPSYPMLPSCPMQPMLAQRGCVCPPGSEATCRGPMCPRQPIGAPT